jgi:hypothetical protein
MNPLLTAIKSGAAPKMVKVAVAKSNLPLPPEILIEAQVILARDRDADVQAAATESLRATPIENLDFLLENKNLTPDVLEFCAQFFLDKPTLVEKIIINPSTPNRAIATVARSVSQSLAELIISNQVRLIEEPGIIAALRTNANLSPGNRKRLEEIEHDFLATPPTLISPAAEEPPAETAESAPILSPEEEAAELVAETAPSKAEEEFIEEIAEGDQEKLTIYQRICKMPVSAKIKVALLGKREERSLLIRDSNRLVAVSVMCSPKLTDSEVEIFSQLRNVQGEVLRMIGSNKEYTKNYRICFNLIKNPKAPVQVTVPLMNRLTSLDLKVLLTERTIPEPIRQQAKRLLARRNL